MYIFKETPLNRFRDYRVWILSSKFSSVTERGPWVVVVLAMSSCTVRCVWVREHVNLGQSTLCDVCVQVSKCVCCVCVCVCILVSKYFLRDNPSHATIQNWPHFGITVCRFKSANLNLTKAAKTCSTCPYCSWKDLWKRRIMNINVS